MHREPGELRGMGSRQNGESAKYAFEPRATRLCSVPRSPKQPFSGPKKPLFCRKRNPRTDPWAFWGVPPVLGSRGETRGGQNQLPTPNSRQVGALEGWAGRSGGHREV